jgi:predicted nucleic acid-binding protein
VSFVIDASFVISWLFPDEGGPHVEKVVLGLLQSGAYAPAHWHVEVSNAVAVSRRRGRFNPVFRDGIVSRFLALPVMTDSAVPASIYPAVIQCAEAHSLSAYDAAYLELARRMKVPLATLDKALAQAAKVEGVSLIGQPS